MHTPSDDTRRKMESHPLDGASVCCKFPCQIAEAVVAGLPTKQRIAVALYASRHMVFVALRACIRKGEIKR